MSSVTRVNGLKTTVGTLYSPGVNMYRITVQNAANSNIDLTAEDDAVDEVVEMIVKEISPLAYIALNASSGIIYVVMDLAINSASELQTRIRNMGTAVGANGVDVTGTDVVAATAFTATP